MGFTRIVLLAVLVQCVAVSHAGDLYRQFTHPPDSARPWVYWYFMDGNLSREGLTADLEAMAVAGIGGAIFLEVGIGIPQGPVRFMSPQWRELFTHAAREADRLGLELALGAGPGWCGTGGPWVKPEESMQHLVCSETTATGPARLDAVLPRPRPRTPFFGEHSMTPQLRTQWEQFYRDVAVLAYPTPAGSPCIADIDEKALYHRAPYSSRPGVKPYLPAPAEYAATTSDTCIVTSRVLDVTSLLQPDGRLTWDVPEGAWTIMRFGRTTTGQTTRPAPTPGLGFECDKFSKSALDAHFRSFVDELLKPISIHRRPGSGLTTLHFDSWEMSSQNWSEGFAGQFAKRRGYDPLRYLPAMAGHVVQSHEVSERFLWDLRQTAQELVVENHAMRLKQLGRRHGLVLSVEPYDLNPCADLTLGGVADVPMCEFWSAGYGYPTEFSCFEAASIAHTRGRTVVAAESFTANAAEAWHQYPGSMKLQGDWALCTGINRIAFHRYQHQPALDQYPGMTMGPYGVHWERTQTWWDMVPAYHLYLARCQQLLRTGLPVADVLYLSPGGAPHVFRPPGSALTDGLPDRRGYNFDGCDPPTLIERASVRDGRVVFPDGMSYRLLVLPRFETMTPALLRKIAGLVSAGATVIGAPPRKSPSLAGYPACDGQVAQLAAQLWGDSPPAAQRRFGKGLIIRDTLEPEPPAPGTASPPAFPDVYPGYSVTARILGQMGTPPDFESDGNLRYTHRRAGGTDLFFLGNRDDHPATATCRFRITGRQPEWWDPVTGARRDLREFSMEAGVTVVPLRFEAGESAFIVFRRPAEKYRPRGTNCPEPQTVLTLNSPWEVSFDPKRGGPAEKSVFVKLDDWSTRPEPGIRHYSGKAVYRTVFDCDPAGDDGQAGGFSLCLGDVKVMASVTMNGKPLGVVWCAPWRVHVPAGVLRSRNNQLEVTVANLWTNRLIGDAGVEAEKRVASTTWNPFQPNSALQPSGLLGPVTLQRSRVRPADPMDSP